MKCANLSEVTAMKLHYILYGTFILGLLFLIAVYDHLSTVAENQARDAEKHIVDQPAKPTIIIVDESAVFERDGYLYYELDGDSDGR